MNLDLISKTERDAKRFLDAAAAWRRRFREDETITFCGSKEGGALRRVSLDLTRALAELRRPG